MDRFTLSRMSSIVCHSCAGRGDYLKDEMQNRLIEHRQYITPLRRRYAAGA